MAKKGLYRISGGTGQEDYVQVDDSGVENSILESVYISRKITPPVNELKWRDDYFAEKKRELLESLNPTPSPQADSVGGSDA